MTQDLQYETLLELPQATANLTAVTRPLAGLANRPAMDDLLQPVLVAGLGRSGTTAMMALLSTSSQIAMTRDYPFEHRYLTRLAKGATLLDRWSQGTVFSDEQALNFEDNAGTSSPGQIRESALLCAYLPKESNSQATLIRQWRLLTPGLRGSAPDARLFAEKAPYWLPALVNRCFPAFTLYLFRDPRDVFLSSNEFMRRGNRFSFGRRPEHSDLDHARDLALGYLTFFENYRADCHRPDTALVTYRELVLDPDRLSERLNRLLKTSITPGAAPSEFINSHRTSAGLAQSLDRWQQERLAPEIVALFERHLREPMTALGYEFSLPPSNEPIGCDFTQHAAQKSAIVPAVESHGSVSPAGTNGLRMTITGDDFHFVLPSVEPFVASSVKEVWMSLSGDVGDHCSIYWRNPKNTFSEERSFHVPNYGGTHWRVVRFPVGKHPLWTGQIAELRIDPLNGVRPAAPQTGHLRWVRLVA